MVPVAASYPGSTASLGPARLALERWLDGQGLGPELPSRAALILSELATNAIHAAPDHDFSVRLDRGPSRTITISVTSRSVGPADLSTVRAAVSGAMPTWTALQGRGLPIVAALSDQVDVSFDAGLVTVTAHLRP